jgi:hypothetical protein
MESIKVKPKGNIQDATAALASRGESKSGVTVCSVGGRVRLDRIPEC